VITGMVRGAAVLARLTVVGLLLGVLVGGVLGRLAMMLLAVLNDEATGLTSDDGFVMGRFTVSGSLNLLLVGGLLGVAGAGSYAALRGLRLGPRWFQLLSLGGGAGVVVCAVLVHSDGIDFTLLRPLWLAVGLFLALPVLYVVLLTVLGERVLRVDDPAADSRLWWLGLLPWLPLFPGLLLLAAGRAAYVVLRPRLAAPAVTGLAWAARAVLFALFLWAAADIGRDVEALT
jgi:hypothetical protein